MYTERDEDKQNSLGIGARIAKTDKHEFSSQQPSLYGKPRGTQNMFEARLAARGQVTVEPSDDERSEALRQYEGKLEVGVGSNANFETDSVSDKVFAEEPGGSEPFAIQQAKDAYSQKRGQKLAGFEGVQGPIRIEITLPFSKQKIRQSFDHVPTYGELEDLANHGDRVRSNRLGLLHPETAIVLSKQPFAYSPFLNTSRVPTELAIGGKKPKISRDQGLQWLAKTLNVDDWTQLKDVNSQEYKRVQKVLSAYVKGSNNEAWEYPEKWRRGALSMDNIISFTMYEIESPIARKDYKDLGGWTKYGIAENYDQDLLKGTGTNEQMIRRLTEPDARAIFVKKYWNDSWNGLPAPKDIRDPYLAYAVFDAAVNSAGKSVKDIQLAFANNSMSPREKANKIFAIRSRDFAGHSTYARALQNRVKKAHRFMEHATSQIAWKRVD